ncbi:aspartate-semialdehyde dehydrogenase [Aquitalea sp. FJL05]|uniref:aspartate-semialdehyde dehydrogenase n=1 Tax=Aquitalea sp. FJL05 TaxID=2153366 RepID=UPI000F5904F0|nr:aspartate-semialdehyde dehydrogenase [Aquitalea sp. FJL05]RQO73044.1 aspartate-semialdehyde dehydrogenase [Aquitalea sp. FJL05]
MMQLAVVGAAGLVGQSVLELLAQRQFPAERVFAVDGPEHEASTVSYGNLELDIRQLDEFGFENVALAIFVAGDSVAREYVPQARAAGVTVIDFSSAFRLDAEVPLVVPAVNAEQLAGLEAGALVAVPNCTVTPLAMALRPLLPLQPKRLTVATYQSVSGSGQKALEELAEQTTALFSQRESENTVFEKRIAFNVLPQIGALDEDGMAEEERSIMLELRRLLQQAELPIEATAVRVPVFFGHAWAVSLEVAADIDLVQVKNRLVAAGLQCVTADQHGGHITPMEATGNDGVWISRLRKAGNTIQFWLAADNVRVGAALNCVLVAEAMYKAGVFE